MKPPLSIALAFLTLWSISSPSSIALSQEDTGRMVFGGAVIQLPTPVGLCHIDGNSRSEKMFLDWIRETQRKAGNMLHSAWADCRSLKEISDGINSDASFKKWAFVVSPLSGTAKNKESLFLGASREQYLEVMTKIISSQKMQTFLSRMIEDVNPILDEVTKKILDENSSIQISKEPISLGILGVTDSLHLGVVMKVEMGKEHQWVGGVLSMTLVKGVPINFYNYAPYQNKGTIKELLDESKDFSIRLIHSN